MRTSLIPGLMDVARRNFNQRAGTVSVFELGRCFSMDNRSEWFVLSGLWSGFRSATPWRTDRVAADILDLKGIVEALLENCEPQFHADTHDAFRTGHCARIMVEERDIGYLGQADTALCATFDLAGPVFVFELDFTELTPSLIATDGFHRLSRFPPIERDLALVVPEQVPAAQLIEQMGTVERELIQAIQLFDVYQGDQVEAGSKSLAFTLVLKSREKTLEDGEADEIIARVLKHVESSCGARLRDS
jgi:phenylalanyl-tRNA synthetase beta chain